MKNLANILSLVQIVTLSEMFGSAACRTTDKRSTLNSTQVKSYSPIGWCPINRNQILYVEATSHREAYKQFVKPLTIKPTVYRRAEHPVKLNLRVEQFNH